MSNDQFDEFNEPELEQEPLPELPPDEPRRRRSLEEVAEDYRIFRGQCWRYCQAALAKDPSLTLVRGHYLCLTWGTNEQHWWLTRPDGTIYDPTARQFPDWGAGIYTPFDGMIECEECGKRVKEKEATTDGHHAFCSGRCHARCVGLEEYYQEPNKTKS